jgi:hypothetical protein
MSLNLKTAGGEALHTSSLTAEQAEELDALRANERKLQEAEGSEEIHSVCWKKPRIPSLLFIRRNINTQQGVKKRGSLAPKRQMGFPLALVSLSISFCLLFLLLSITCCLLLCGNVCT